MKNRTIKLPVLVLVAVVALVIGSFGTATAAGITKSQVKRIATKVASKVVNQKAGGLTVARAKTADGVPDNAINGADVANGSLTAADLAAGTVPSVLFARVAADGTLSSGSGAVSAVRTGVGAYTVTFNRSVVNCAALVTVFSPDQRDYMITTQTAAGQIIVDMETPANTDTQADASFNMGVLC